MKNLLSIMLLLFVSFIACGQNDTIQSSLTVTETERIIDKYSSKISDAFNDGIEKVSPTVKEGFEVVVKLKIAEGIAYLLPLIMFIIFLILFVHEYNSIANMLASDNCPQHLEPRYGVLTENNANPKLLIYLIFSVLMFMVAISNTLSGITHLIAPEWYALKEIIDLF